jgi:hypothetical protein
VTSAALEGLSRGAVGIGDRVGVTVAIPGRAVEGLSRGAVGIGQRIGVTVAIPGKVAQDVLNGVSALGHAADSTTKRVSDVVETIGETADAIEQADIPKRMSKTARSVFVGVFMIGRRPAGNAEYQARLFAEDLPSTTMTSDAPRS